MLGVDPAQLGGDERAPVAPLGAVAPVAEAGHQLGPGDGDAVGGPAGLAGRAGEAVAGQGRDHQVEGVARVAAVGAWVGQRADDAQELHDRAGPAMGEDQRQGLWLRGADVEEVDRLAVDGGGELRVLVQPRLVLAPVVAVTPVGGQLLEIVERHPAAPADPGQLVGPAGTGQPVAQVVEVGLGDVDPERPDPGVGRVAAGHGSSSPCALRSAVSGQWLWRSWARSSGRWIRSMVASAARSTRTAKSSASRLAIGSRT
jgi:hypothetical protein